MIFDVHISHLGSDLFLWTNTVWKKMHELFTVFLLPTKFEIFKMFPIWHKLRRFRSFLGFGAPHRISPQALYIVPPSCGRSVANRCLNEVAVGFDGN
jgi:hypothetical protein